MKKAMSESWHLSDAPFAGYQLSNNNAKIKNTKARLERLKKVKEAGTKETENDFFKVVENTELMRLQLFFDGKPDEETRDIVKKNMVSDGHRRMDAGRGSLQRMANMP